jgi:hypothetical protein
MKHPYFAGLQETAPSKVPSAVSQHQHAPPPAAATISNHATIDLDSEIFDQTTTKSNTTPKPILNNKTNQPVTSVAQPFSYNSGGPQAGNKKLPYKDSIGDLDDMINDFETKYSSPQKATDHKPSNNHNNNSNMQQKQSIGGSNSNVAAAVTNNNANQTRPVLKTPVHMQGKRNSNANIKESLLAQFKEDPVFGDLLSSNTTNSNNAAASNNSNQVNPFGNKIPNANVNLSSTNLQLGNRRNSNLNGLGNNADSSKIDSNLQKKKFDDLFSNFDSNTNKNTALNSKST